MSNKTNKAFHTFEMGNRKITIGVIAEARELGSNTTEISVGYSVCMLEDEFDEKLSRDIAEGRARKRKSRLDYIEVFATGTKGDFTRGTSTMVIGHTDYSLLKNIAISWARQIAKEPTRYIKGLRDYEGEVKIGVDEEEQ